MRESRGDDQKIIFFKKIQNFKFCRYFFKHPGKNCKHLKSNLNFEKLNRKLDFPSLAANKINFATRQSQHALSHSRVF